MIQQQLVKLSRYLGDPIRDLVILSEGNSSAAISKKTMWIKKSGSRLESASVRDFLKLKTKLLVELCESDESPGEKKVQQVFQESKVNPKQKGLPSIEVFIHASLIAQGAKFIGHTHPTPVVAILSSNQPRLLSEGHLFPDSIVILGKQPLFIPYYEVGWRLGQVVHRETKKYLKKYQEFPRVIFLQNHGLVAIGETPAEVIAITEMAVKVARVAIGAINLKGLNYLSEKSVKQLDTRADEKERRKKIKN